MPMRLDDGWNQIQFNLADFTRRAYGTNYVETLRVQIHANCRIRRVYFSDRLYSEEELPAEFKLYLPVQQVRTITITVAHFSAKKKWDIATSKWAFSCFGSSYKFSFTLGACEYKWNNCNQYKYIYVHTGIVVWPF